jgi:ornithine cyclodeaminase/alanine dehydrogenase
MKRAIGLMAQAFTHLSADKDCVPPRVVMAPPGSSLALFFKPAFMSNFGRMSVKIITQLLENCDPCLPTIKGMVLLFDMKTGHLLAMADGSRITSLRTGAASGIATRYLANHDASSVAVFGCGAQGRTQLEAVTTERRISRICLFDTKEMRARELAAEGSRSGHLNIEVNPDLQVLKEMDIICTATPSSTPLFSYSNLKPGVHINAVGSYKPDMQELDPELFRNSLIYLDDSDACLGESGDLLGPIKSGILAPQEVMGEIGQLISGQIRGRTSHNEITVFKSVGNAIQDFFIINEAYKASLAKD